MVIDQKTMALAVVFLGIILGVIIVNRDLFFKKK